jgi:NodT family efflux transporter outer membrane factor (OMF) lipoprotein
MLGGCTGISEYFRNDCKVGPGYTPPCAPVAHNWIDATDQRVRTTNDDLAGWWTVFGDPLLNDIVLRAYNQNLTLREAGYRIMAARAQLGIANGEFFPQSQTTNGAYRRIGSGGNFFDQWNFNFNLAWELDFWGRFRRAIEAAEMSLDASVFDYDDATVTLLSDTANAYVAIRTTQERIRLLDDIIEVQEKVYLFIDERVKAGKGATELDRAQALSNLEQSRSQRHQFLIDLRVAENQLCILLGMPAIDLTNLLACGPKKDIPVAPTYVVTGIPADLLRRRPDVRRAERLAAAQAEQIGIAETDWYPAISINGTLGWQAQNLSDLFRPASLNSNVGPSFQWNLLNYGRILSNVRLQDAQFRQLVTAYQSTVLNADLEVENGIVTFVQAQQKADDLRKSVDDAWRALQVIVAQYQAGLGGIDFNRYATIQQTLVTQQDQWAQSRGQIALGLIQVYRGLGGGWQIKNGCPPDKQGILSPGVGSTNQPAQSDDQVKPLPEIIPPPAL